MKGIKIPFDIKYRPQIESGEYKVCDQEGNNARIICWDALNKANPDQCIIALIKEGSNNDEDNKWYDTKGFGALRHNRLFIIIPETELTDLEKAIKRGMLCAGLEGVSTTIIKETAKEVKDIICRGCTVSIDNYIKGRKDAMEEAEISNTFHYPFYPAMCFHGGVCTNPMRDCINCPMHSSGATTNTTSGTCKKD